MERKDYKETPGPDGIKTPSEAPKPAELTREPVAPGYGADDIIRRAVSDRAARAMEHSAFPKSFAARETLDDEADLYLKKAIIYIVDDQAPVRRLLEHVFKGHGCERVRSFNDGEKVLEAIFGPDGKTVRELPAVIVSDTEMPGVKGPDMYKRIAERGLTEFIVVLGMSGNPANRALWSGSMFMAKPFATQDVIDNVKAELVRRAAWTPRN